MSLVSGKKPAVDEPLGLLRCEDGVGFSHLFHDVASWGVSVVGWTGVCLGRLCSVWRTG